MKYKKRDFNKAIGSRPYKRKFIISTEGILTEPEYFKHLKKFNNGIHILLAGGKGSSPNQVLKHMKNKLDEDDFKSSDEAWLVVDKDQWTEKQLNELIQWTKKKTNYFLALSNPKFEYWLLLHFEGGGISSINNCIRRLKKYIPKYKSIDKRKYTLERIKDAVNRARNEDTPPCINWPRHFGRTTVYLLVDKIINT
ncbi:MAG: RloB family protein [Paracoccaceae bacterium]|nr:RloB family protein [Paracoccaceae bacterium]MDE2675595.1 RloB family protein [Paracoccaceae bacterium]